MSPHSPAQNIDNHTREAEQNFAQGIALLSQHGDIINALPLLRKAAQALPERADISYNYGVALQRAGFLQEAVLAWQRTTNLAPQQAVPWENLCLGLSLLGQVDTALEAYGRALALHPTNRDLLYNHANLLYRAGRGAQALTAFDALLQAYPEDPAGLINAGMAAKSAALYDKAELHDRRAMQLSNPALHAMAQFNLANLLLLQEKWDEGFDAYEARLRLPDSAPIPWGLPAFHDQLPTGSRILLWNDQGAGDAMMFARFIPALAARGYRLFLFAQTPLKTLLSSLTHIEKVFCPTDSAEAMDAALPLCSLPATLKLDPRQAWSGPYLSSPQNAEPMALPARNPSAKKIGLVWAGRATHENDANRSMKLSDFAPLLALHHVNWYSLQVGGPAAACASLPKTNQIEDLSPLLTDFAATAGVLSQLDLLISVDTAPAHLAGAMGVPVWTLLPAIDSDWRWGVSGHSTFWYPSMRLFRQTQAGNWSALIESLLQKISEPC